MTATDHAIELVVAAAPRLRGVVLIGRPLLTLGVTVRSGLGVA